MGIQWPLYRFSSPKVAPYFSWKEPLTSNWYRSVEAQFSYYFTGFTYLDVQVNDSRLEEVVRLGYLGQQIVLDGRNDPVFPKGRYTISIHKPIRSLVEITIMPKPRSINDGLYL